MKACSRGGVPRAAVLDQIREHGLAGARTTRAPEDKERRAEELRENQTNSEHALGVALRRLKKWAFYAQVPLHGYIVDFYAPEVMLAVEVDGGVHAGREVRDELRDAALRSQGVAVLRFPVERVLTDVDAVLREIKTAARKRHGLGSRLGELELDYLLYRHGLPEPQEERPSPRAPPAVKTVAPKSRFWCFDCERAFVATVRPFPECHENKKHKVRGVCRRCRQPRATAPPMCDPCREAAEVARASAGPGARAPAGELRQARRAKRYKGR